MPESPSRTTIGKRTRASPTASCLSPPGFPKGVISQGASTIPSAVRPPSPSRISQKRLEATRQARLRSPFSSSSLKTGTNAEEIAASASSARTRFGTWNATVNALIRPCAPK
jgi:hypothetical protein